MKSERGFWMCLGAFSVFALAAILTGSLGMLLVSFAPLVIMLMKHGPGRTPIDSSAGSRPHPPCYYEETAQWQTWYLGALDGLDVEFPPPPPPAKRYRDIADAVLDGVREPEPGTPIRISSPAAIPFMVHGEAAGRLNSRERMGFWNIPDGGYEARVCAAAKLQYRKDGPE